MDRINFVTQEKKRIKYLLILHDVDKGLSLWKLTAYFYKKLNREPWTE